MTLHDLINNKLIKICFFTVILLGYSTLAGAQGEMNMHHNVSGTDSDGMVMGDTLQDRMQDMHDMHDMNSALSLALPMSRNGSGTSWLPDAAPVYGYMTDAGKWTVMLHGDIFLRYNRQDIGGAGQRGDEKWDAPDMLMAMGQRRIGQRGLFHIQTMFSTDAIIAGGSGYPLLFQTGESWKGKPLVDRQHPHDLFSELSVSYAYEFSRDADAFVYVGYPGEPALGPVTFMHRTSGEFMPDAPIGHHWADATHITFGVATIGVRYGRLRLEGSSFTGREPDENRYNFDKPLFDSWSGRLSFNPSSNWALQVSRGLLKSPEALQPNEDVSRSTVSATCVYPVGTKKYFAATTLWGQNAIAGFKASNTALVEATLKLGPTVVYTRYERVQKSGEELSLAPAVFDVHSLYDIYAVTVGGGYDLFNVGAAIIAFGGQLSLSHSGALSALYASYPVSGEIYLHVYPALMK